MANDNLTKLIEQNLTWKKSDKNTSFLNKYKWKPKYIFFDPINNLHIAVDIIFNQQISERIYKAEVLKAIKENPNLRVCLFSSLDYDYNILKGFCKKNKLGLKVYDSVSINTILPFKTEKIERITSKKTKKEGWFPQLILSEVKKSRK